MKLYLASGNPHKAAEFQALADLQGNELNRPDRGSVRRIDAGRIECLPAQAVGGMPPVEEDAGSFVGNARKKARALKPHLPSGAWALADDSGLCVDALGGGPGVESAYFAGPDRDDAANMAKLLEVLRGVPDGRRGAHFRCVLVVLAPDGSERVFEGRCAGRLLAAPRGEGGFGYDPLFVPDGGERSFAELTRLEKSRIGHRGMAWAALVEGLRDTDRGGTEE